MTNNRFTARMFSRASVAALIVALAACTGRIGDAPGGGSIGTGGPGGTGATGGNTPATNPVAFTCSNTAPAASPPWRRLTHVEFDNTTKDLLVLALNGDTAEASKAWNEASPAWANLYVEQRVQVPIDRHGSSRRMDQDVLQEHANIWYQAAVAMGKALTTSARIGKVLGSCATDTDQTNDAACLTSFIQKFGERALRKVITDDDLQFYLAYYGPTAGVDPVAVADVIAGLLLAPQFSFEVMHGDAPAGQDGVFKLNAYELASRLSFHFWATIPDDQLWSAAKSGALLTDAEYAKQVTRLMADPRARTSLLEFFRDWLKVDDVNAFDPTLATTQFKAFAGQNLPTAALHDAIVQDVLDMVAHFTWEQPGKLDDVLTTDLSFARTPDLAQIYGLDPWDGSGAPPSFPAGQRTGLLTRAAFLVTGTAITRPVEKGLFVRECLLCDEIPLPPPNAMADAAQTTKDLADQVLSTRQVLEAVTEAKQPCVSCHKPLINPLGFVTEGFDALGRARTQENVLADDGTVRGSVPVDTHVVPGIVLGDPADVAGPDDLATMLVGSGKPNACAAREYFRFAFGRYESPDTDGCVLERLRTAVSDKDLPSMLQEVALTPEFMQRTFQ